MNTVQKNQGQTAGFIGGGNMTAAIVAGLLRNGFEPGRLAIAEPNDARRTELRKAYAGVQIAADNQSIVARSDCVVLAVKPQVIANVCKDLAAAVQKHRPLIVSIAAGPRIADIDAWLGGSNAVVRVMPNQPALLGAGVSGLYANATAGSGQVEFARQIMAAVGSVVDVAEESDIDSVTAVSGSGPAYFYLVVDAIAETAVELGLDASAARELAIETAYGAASVARQSDEPMSTLIARVRSPGGTTAAALDSLEDGGVRAIFRRALTAARDRATELADAAHEAGKD